MMNYPNIDPVALSLGPLKVHWYGLSYLMGISLCWWLARRRQKKSVWSADNIDDMLFYLALGVIVGGRMGYIFFYNFKAWFDNPFILFQVWNGGMSFHGGLIGVLIAAFIFAKKEGKTFFELTDFIAPFVPVGLFCGRIGNFINGELWGKVGDFPWTMRLPCNDWRFQQRFCEAGQLWSAPHHPSMLYEAILEGILLFIILFWFSAKPRPRMAVSGLFLIGYGTFRFLVEFIRLPDVGIDYFYGGWLTQGQILSTPMIIFGSIMCFMAYRNRHTK